MTFGLKITNEKIGLSLHLFLILAIYFVSSFSNKHRILLQYNIEVTYNITDVIS